MRRSNQQAATSIPLQCTICPSQPDFSDVSHLLTHIGSKGHLGHQFQLEVKAATDDTSRRLIQQYSEWYNRYNVQGMMAQRLKDKEEKKKKTAANASINRVPSRRTSQANSVASSRSTPTVTALHSRRPGELREATLDPQLGPGIKREPKSRSATPNFGFASEGAFARSYAPPMQGWNANPLYMMSTQTHPSFLDSFYTTPSSDDSEDASTNEDPPSSRLQRRRPKGRNHSVDDDDFGSGQNENVKLKGVVWPGMDLFDSATPEMRRKRNQKKADSVIWTLMATSGIVEAIEQVYDSDGRLRRERPITGNPEEDDGHSPLLGEHAPEIDSAGPKKKKPGRRARSAITEKDRNSGRALPIRRKSQYLTVDLLSRGSSYYEEMDEDDELTYGQRPARKRTGLSIHRDQTGPEITFNRPAPMTALTSGFRNPFHASLDNVYAPIPTGLPPRHHQRQPSFPYGQPFPHHQPGIAPPVPGLGSFGQLNGSSLFANASFANNPFGMMNGQQNFAAAPPPMGIATSSFANDNNYLTVSSLSQNGLQNNAGWGYFPPDPLGVNNGINNNDPFGIGNDFGSVNPLFMGGIHNGGEDEEATISPPSQH